MTTWSLTQKMFLLSGIIGSTIRPKTHFIQVAMFTLFSVYACIIPFIFPNVYATDNRFILACYIITVYLVYISCVKYFKLKNDKILYVNLENECTSSQILWLKITIILFIICGIYCQLGIPLGLVGSSSSEYLVLATVLLGFYWLQFYIVCCSIFIYINTYCFGQYSVIKNWLKGLKRGTHPKDLDSMYQMYSHFYNTGKYFRKLWINIILITFCIITFRIPISFILLVYSKFYFESVLLVFNVYAWFTLLIPICNLNEINSMIKFYFYKHPHIIESTENIEKFIKFSELKPLGLIFYGFTLKFNHLLTIVIVVLNVIVPVFLSFLIGSVQK
jgi:hypothetical protein